MLHQTHTFRPRYGVKSPVPLAKQLCCQLQCCTWN